MKSLGVHDVYDLGCLCCWGQEAQGDYVRGFAFWKKLQGQLQNLTMTSLA